MRRMSLFLMATLILLLIAALIIFFTVNKRQNSLSSIKVLSAANIIAADLDYAKGMAISRAQNFSVVFDKVTDRYWIEDQNDTLLSHPVKKGFDYVVDFQNDSMLNEVDIIVVDFDTTSKVTFDYLGSPYNGSGTVLNNGVIRLQAGNMNTTVRIDAVTGNISIE